MSSGDPARLTVLTSIREHLARDRTEPGLASPPETPPAGTPPIDAAPLGLRFTERLMSVGGQVHSAATESEAAAIINRVLREHGVRSVAWSDAPLLQRIRTQVPQAATADPPSREDLLTCEAGITTAQWGIAETGTLVLASSAERHRLASLLPPIHVALLPADRLVPTLGAVLQDAARAPGGLPPTLTLITGPSRTADIELTLVIGVHGPRHLHVILLDRPQGPG